MHPHNETCLATRKMSDACLQQEQTEKLSHWSQARQQDKYHIILLIHVALKKGKYKLIHKRRGVTEAENETYGYQGIRERRN